MMKVWVLFETQEFEGSSLLGIYKTEVRANEEAKIAKENFKKRWGSPRNSGKFWETQEWEVE